MTLIGKIISQSLTYSFAATIALTTAMGLVGIDRTANAEVPASLEVGMNAVRASATPERCSTHASSSTPTTWLTSDAPVVPSVAAPESASSRCWSAWRR